MISYRQPQSFSGDDMNNHYLFVYRTLMNPHVREFVLKHKEDAKKAVLKGYKRLIIPNTKEGRDYETLEFDSKAKMTGDLMQIDYGDLVKLAKWEDQYYLMPITVTCNNKYINAHAFVLKQQDIR